VSSPFTELLIRRGFPYPHSILDAGIFCLGEYVAAHKFVCTPERSTCDDPLRTLLGNAGEIKQFVSGSVVQIKPFVALQTLAYTLDYSLRILFHG